MDNIFVITGFSIFVLIALIFIGIKKQATNEEYLAISQTNWMRGIAIVMIMFSHYYARIGILSKGAWWQLGMFGVLGVAIFLFLSGYAAMISKINKPKYLKGYLPKRLLKLYIPFVLFYILEMLLLTISGHNFTIPDFLGCIVMSMPGTLNWYLKVQLGLYAIFYLLAKFIKCNKKLVLCIFLVCLIYMLIGFITKIDSFWYESSYMFPMGMIFALYKDKIYRYISNKYIIKFSLSIFIFGLLYIPYYLWGGVLPEIIFILGFMQLVLVLCIKLGSNNKATAEIGKISLELYLSHGTMLLAMANFQISDDIITFAIFFIGSIMLAFIANKLCNHINGKILTNQR